MSAPFYSAYRDTGVEWLGAVPSHWQVVRLNALFREVGEPGSDDLPVLSVSIHSGVSDTELADDEVDRVVARSEDRSKYKRVQPNDLVYNMMRAWQGGFGAVQTVGAVSPAYVVARPTSSQSTRFIERLLRTPNAVGEMKRLSKGVTDFRLRLYWDEFKNIKVALPPPSEQVAIDAFLDRETAKIDALVEEQRRLIELLKEKRQAAIFHAVTKGLDPSAPMKDTGVDWLGPVPAHWEVVPIKRLARLQSGEAITSTDIEEAGPFPVYGGNGFRGFTERFTHEGDFVLIGRQGALCGNINYAQGQFWASEHAIVAHPRLAFCTRWFGELLRTMNLGQYSVAAAQPGLSADVIGNLRCPSPPIDEQVKIAYAIEVALGVFDPLTSEAESAIALLQERRAALISAAVTGKIDVRGLSQAAEAA